MQYGGIMATTEENDIEDDQLAMSRMAWLYALRPLFDSLKAFNDDQKKRHVEKSNFMDALGKVKTTLDLRKPDMQDAETQICYTTAFQQFEEHLPEYFTWDNLFDVLLFSTVASQFVCDLHEADDVNQELTQAD